MGRYVRKKDRKQAAVDFRVTETLSVHSGSIFQSSDTTNFNFDNSNITITTSKISFGLLIHLYERIDLKARFIFCSSYASKGSRSSGQIEVQYNLSK